MTPLSYVLVIVFMPPFVMEIHPQPSLQTCLAQARSQIGHPIEAWSGDLPPPHAVAAFCAQGKVELN